MAKRSKKGGKRGGNKPAVSASTDKRDDKTTDKRDDKTTDKRDDKTTDKRDGKTAVKQDPTTRSRGQQRREAMRAERRTAGRIADTSPSAPAEEPVFWFGFEVPWAKLVLGRFVFFVLLAVDSLLNFAHAPRYGAGDFNVAQIPIFDVFAPTRPSYAIGQLLCAWLFVLAACGAATRIVLPIATVIYGWLYFGSHLDSYQHHYLVWLVVLVSCFVPWQRPANAVATTRVRSWALRVILLQLAILYLWAAFSKIDPAWVDGRTLGSQIHGAVRKFIDGTVGIKGASILVIVAELGLAATVWNKRTWWIAAPLGIVFHLGIVFTNLEIGLFAWLMVGLYIFIVPDRFWVWLAEKLGSLGELVSVVREWFGGAVGWIALVMSAAAGFILAVATRYDYSAVVGVGLLVGVLGLAFSERAHVGRLAGAHVLAFVVWLIVDRTSTSAQDYYRFWGGSSRRLGDMKTAEHAYRKMTEVAPTEGQGHFQLGKLLLARGADEEGLAELRRAQQFEPLKSRAYTAEAKWLAEHGKKEEAIMKAREAAIIDPGDNEALTLLDSLGAR